MTKKENNLKTLLEKTGDKFGESIPYKFKWYEWLIPWTPFYGLFYSMDIRKTSVFAYRKKYYGVHQKFPESVLKYVRRKVYYNLGISIIVSGLLFGFGVTYLNKKLIQSQNLRQIQSETHALELERSKFKKIFFEFDKNGSGYIESDEMMNKYDLDDDNLIDFNEFIKMSNGFPRNTLNLYQSRLDYLKTLR